MGTKTNSNTGTNTITKTNTDQRSVSTEIFEYIDCKSFKNELSCEIDHNYIVLGHNHSSIVGT